MCDAPGLGIANRHGLCYNVIISGQGSVCSCKRTVLALNCISRCDEEGSPALLICYPAHVFDPEEGM